MDNRNPRELFIREDLPCLITVSYQTNGFNEVSILTLSEFPGLLG